ncbi:aspartic proteinase Mkc7p [[Candida] railenensis]|uniref:candidapepsin n=1 Tax=[Candida] railenensis TaxID=45579 RepID=A0A9P0QUW8_9ASCO|nr:aspartic proteinase Mkc7p [[Candida] railenensis]
MRFHSTLCISTLVASVVTATSPLKVDFEIQRGNSLSDLSVDKKPYLYKRDGEVGLTLANSVNLYLATIKIGSEEDEVTVQIDTGSSDLWVMASDVECFVPISNYKRDDDELILERRDDKKSKSASSSEAPSTTEIEYFEPQFSSVPTGTEAGDIAETNTCIAYGSFATGSSSSFKVNETVPDFYIVYGDLTGAFGVWGQDTVVIGDAAVDSLSFGIANQTSTNIGILGIGLQNLESTVDLQNDSISYTYENLPVALKSQGYIEKIAYSLFLNDENATTGSILFGAVDHAKYTGPLVTVPLLTNLSYDPGQMHFLVDSIGVDVGNESHSLTDNKYTAIFDSGTSLTVLPSSLYERFGELVGGNYSDEYGYYKVPCPSGDEEINLVLNFSGAILTVPYSNLIMSGDVDYAPTSTCFLGTQNSSESYTVFGDNVLVSGYFVYDLEDLTISIAQANYTDETDIEILSGSIPGAKDAPLYSSTEFIDSVAESSATYIISYETASFTPPDIAYISSGIFNPNSTISRPGTSYYSETEESSTSQTGKASSSPIKASGVSVPLQYSLVTPFALMVISLMVVVSL